MKPELVDCIASLRDNGTDLKTVAEQMLYSGYTGRIQFAIMNPDAFPSTAQSGVMVGIIRLCRLISNDDEYLQVINALKGNLAVQLPDYAIGQAVSLPDKDADYLVSDIYFDPGDTTIKVALQGQTRPTAPIVRLPLKTLRNITRQTRPKGSDPS